MTKKYIRTYLFPFLLLIVVWIFFCKYNMDQYKRHGIENVISVSRSSNAYTSGIMLRNIQEIVGNLKLVRDSAEAESYLTDPNKNTYNVLAEMFLRFMKNKDDLARMTLTDQNGLELIRVERDHSGVPVLSEQLKDRSADDFFKKAIKMSADDFYIASLSQAAKAQEDNLMRFAMPVIDEQNVRRGVLSISYSSSFFTKLMRDESVYKGFQNETFCVVNEAGNFILRPTEIKDDVMKSVTVPKAALPFENVMEQLKKSEFSYNVIGSKLFVYYDVLSDARSEISDFQNRYWIAVHEIDLSQMFSFSVLARETNLFRSVFIFLVLTFLLWVLTFLWNRLRTKDSQLNMTMQIAESSSDAVVVTDINTKIIYINAAYENMTGYTSEEVVGCKPSDYKSGKHDITFYEKMWASILDKGEWKGLLWDKKKNGLLYPKILHIIAVNDKRSGETQHYIGMFSNLLVKELDDIEDPALPGVGKLLMQTEGALLELMEGLLKDDDAQYLIMNIEIENYNQIVTKVSNMRMDIDGVFFALFRSFIHEEDIAVQIGRNHFVAVVKVQKDGPDMEQLANLMFEKMAKSINYTDINFYFKVRIGTSSWPSENQTMEKSLLNAMLALEWAQKNRIEGVVAFNEDINRQLMQEAEIDSLLRNAVSNKEFYLVYQPQIDVHTGRIVGAEALLRWDSPLLGNVSPSVFIPIAEKNNMIIEIGNWILEQVCSDFSPERTQNLITDQNFRCAINVSAIQMEECFFFDKFISVVDGNQISFQRIEVEVTESAVITNMQNHCELFKDLQQKGFAIAIDDFGTGYSSLSYLNQLPVDKIKIDRSFIKDYPDQDDGKLIEILVEMVKRLGKTVLVEGVETIHQVDYLNQLGCDQIQGFFYSRPLRLNEFFSYYTQNNQEH